MSKQLVDFAIQFTEGKVTADAFVSEYIERWKQEGVDGRLLQDTPEVSEMLSTIFCFADLYNPSSDRENYEFDETTLRCKVQMELEKI
jgi:hypothetical protein